MGEIKRTTIIIEEEIDNKKSTSVFIDGKKAKKSTSKKKKSSSKNKSKNSLTTKSKVKSSQAKSNTTSKKKSKSSKDRSSLDKIDESKLNKNEIDNISSSQKEIKISQENSEEKNQDTLPILQKNEVSAEILNNTNELVLKESTKLNQVNDNKEVINDPEIIDSIKEEKIKDKNELKEDKVIIEAIIKESSDKENCKEQKESSKDKSIDNKDLFDKDKEEKSNLDTIDKKDTADNVNPNKDESFKIDQSVSSFAATTNFISSSNDSDCQNKTTTNSLNDNNMDNAEDKSKSNKTFNLTIKAIFKDKKTRLLTLLTTLLILLLSILVPVTTSITKNNPNEFNEIDKNNIDTSLFINKEEFFNSALSLVLSYSDETTKINFEYKVDDNEKYYISNIIEYDNQKLSTTAYYDSLNQEYVYIVNSDNEQKTSISEEEIISLLKNYIYQYFDEFLSISSTLVNNVLNEAIEEGYTNHYYYQENSGLYRIDGGENSPYEIIFSKDGIVNSLIINQENNFSFFTNLSTKYSS